MQDIFEKVFLMESDGDSESSDQEDIADEMMRMADLPPPPLPPPPEPPVGGPRAVGHVPEAASSSDARSSAGRLQGVARQYLAEYVITDEMGTFIGTIKVDKIRKQFNAHCCQLGPPAIHDHRTRTTPECRLNRVATKRPLGYLIQWLRQSSAFHDREEHRLSAELITRADRDRCRQWLRETPELEDLMKQEAEWNGLAWEGPGTVGELE